MLSGRKTCLINLLLVFRQRVVGICAFSAAISAIVTFWQPDYIPLLTSPKTFWPELRSGVANPQKNCQGFQALLSWNYYASLKYLLPDDQGRQKDLLIWQTCAHFCFFCTRFLFYFVFWKSGQVRMLKKTKVSGHARRISSTVSRGSLHDRVSNVLVRSSLMHHLV